jgi:serine/threonine-protein kinase
MAAADRIGSLIASKYRLEELLGEGGMGAVWKAAHVTVGKRFAVKVLHAEVSKHPDAKRRFTHEAQAAAKIGHPAILDVYDLGEDDGELYMVMELLDGESLAQRVARGPMRISESLEYAIGVLDALQAAHGASVIHRDIKPANVFLVRGESGRAAVRVLDFGIAKFQEAADDAKTSSGAVLGSAYYMAPEQVRAETEIDARADVWAVGATIYELLVGEPAHKAPTHSAVIARIVMTPASPMSQRRKDVDPKLDAIVARALRIDRDERFSSAAEMRDAIEAYLVERAETTDSAPPPSLTPSVKERRAEARSKSDGDTPRAVVAGATDLSPLTGGDGSAPRARSLVPVALVALLIGVLASVAVASRTKSTPSAPAEAPPPASLPLVVPTAASPEPAASISASTPSPSAAPAPTPSATAAPLPKQPASSPPPSARPRQCATGEALTEGHCCVRGFVWRNDHCERDIAVNAPF